MYKMYKKETESEDVGLDLTVCLRTVREYYYK